MPDGAKELILLDNSGKNESLRYLTDGFWPDWSPLENKFVFSRGEDLGKDDGRGQIVIYDLDTDTETILINGSSRSGFQPAWSPAGSMIAYLSNTPEELPPRVPAPGEVGCGNWQQSIEIMDVTGNHLKSATECLKRYFFDTDTGWRDGYPPKVSAIQNAAWRPDGHEIAYIGSYAFEYVTGAGYEQTIVHKHQPYKIDLNAQEDLALFKIDDGENAEFWGMPTWSLDGRQLVMAKLGVLECAPDCGSNVDTATRLKADIYLVDPPTGVPLKNLTMSNGRGDYYPDVAY